MPKNQPANYLFIYSYILLLLSYYRITIQSTKKYALILFLNSAQFTSILCTVVSRNRA